MGIQGKDVTLHGRKPGLSTEYYGWYIHEDSMILLFKGADNPSKAIILLHEHDLRIGSYASAFILTGLGVRMSQALQINLERSNRILSSSGPLQWSHREARRRLMWSVYIMDSVSVFRFPSLPIS